MIAPDSFKESLSAFEVAEAMKEGASLVLPDASYHLLPLADGGEGTAEALYRACGGRWVRAFVPDALGREVEACYALLSDGVAVIEMAKACGLQGLAKEERNPLIASSYGFGALIAHALHNGVRRFILAIGGSATNDGGAGMLQALGVRFFDDKGCALSLGAKALLDLDALCLDDAHLLRMLQSSEVLVACDVQNVLLGDFGATAVFARQKGADEAMLPVLERALAHYADCMARAGFFDAREALGSGAAGGVGFALLGACQARFCAGADLVMEKLGLFDVLKGADLLLTGEGKMDQQTLFGKLPFAVLNQGIVRGVPTVAVAGSVGGDVEALYEAGFLAVLPSVIAPCSEKEAFCSARDNVRMATRAAVALWAAGRFNGA